MPGLPSGRDIPEESIRPGYFFYGEEMFPAHQFIRELKTALFSPDNEGMSIERFTTTETPWREIIDIARIIPFFSRPGVFCSSRPTRRRMESCLPSR